MTCRTRVERWPRNEHAGRYTVSWFGRCNLGFNTKPLPSWLNAARALDLHRRWDRLSRPIEPLPRRDTR